MTSLPEPLPHTPPAGWYAAPDGTPQMLWWDGAAWTEHSAPLNSQMMTAPDPMDNAAMRMVLPVGRSGWAIAAGYMGLFAFIPIFAPFALVLGIVAVLHVRAGENRHGMGRAIFAIIMGLLGSGILVALALS